jgi:hypothetical protein
MIDVERLIHATGKPRAIVETANWLLGKIKENPDFQYLLAPTVFTEDLCWHVLLSRGSQEDFEWLLIKGIATERDRDIWNNVVDAFTVTAADVLVEELEDAE